MTASLRLVIAAVATTAAFGCSKPVAAPTPVARGEHLVTIMGCNDCHTPWTMGANGPAPDTTRLLSGHPQQLTMPPAPQGIAPPWGFVGAMTMTAWAGPWGVSYTANLTPDGETGLGFWSDEMFIQAMRTGRHMGGGRPILPPMPVQGLAALPDEDLKAVLAYLKSIPPIKNRVPGPVLAPPPNPAEPR